MRSTQREARGDGAGELGSQAEAASHVELDLHFIL